MWIEFRYCWAFICQYSCSQLKMKKYWDKLIWWHFTCPFHTKIILKKKKKSPFHSVWSGAQVQIWIFTEDLPPPRREARRKYGLWSSLLGLSLPAVGCVMCAVQSILPRTAVAVIHYCTAKIKTDCTSIHTVSCCQSQTWQAIGAEFRSGISWFNLE